MKVCHEACPYNTLRGCVAEEEKKPCPFGYDKPITNGDHIRSLNDTGLATIFCYFLTSTLRRSGINAVLGDSFQESFAEWLAEPFEEE